MRIWERRAWGGPQAFMLPPDGLEGCQRLSSGFSISWQAIS